MTRIGVGLAWLGVLWWTGFVLAPDDAGDAYFLMLALCGVLVAGGAALAWPRWPR